MALNADQQAAYDRLFADLKDVWDDRGPPAVLQANLALAGYVAIRLFVNMADLRAELRNALAADFNLDPAARGLDAAARIERRTNQARALGLWEAARRRQEERARVEAEQRAASTPMAMSTAEQVLLMQRREQGGAHLRCA